MALSLSLHIIGITMWVGGLMILTRVMKVLSEPYQAEGLLAKTIRRIYWGFIVPGAVLVLLTGLHQIGFRGAAYYMSQGWFHTKLSFALILAIVTIFVGVAVRASLRGEIIRAPRMGALHGVSGACLLIIVILTMLNR